MIKKGFFNLFQSKQFYNEKYKWIKILNSRDKSQIEMAKKYESIIFRNNGNIKIIWIMPFLANLFRVNFCWI